MRKISLYWWYVRYAILAVNAIRCSPAFAWSMATANGDDEFKDGISPKDALYEELSYWDGD